MAKELKNTLVISGEEYNINAKKAEEAKEASHAVETDHAVEADHANASDIATEAETANKLAKTLKITKVNLGNTVDVDFNGESDKTIKIVPADGGRFTGRITTATDKVSRDIIARDPETVLNSAHIKTYIVDELIRKSVKCSWNGSELVAEATDASNASIPSICIVTGDSTAANGFALYNNQNYINRNEEGRPPFLSAFIYVSTDDGNNGNIYFGTCDSDHVAGVQVSADKANYAVSSGTAEQLAQSSKFVVNLSDDFADKETEFNGTQDDVVLGIRGTLSPAHGGTGQTDLANVTVGKAAVLSGVDPLNNLREISAAEVYDKFANADGVARNMKELLDGVKGLPKINTYMSFNTGSNPVLYSVKTSVILSTNAPHETDGINGDIWIQYS